MGEGENLAEKVVDALTSTTAENHDSRTDPAQTAAERVASGMGGDEQYKKEVKKIAADLARNARSATFVNAQGVGQPSRMATGIAEVEIEIVEANAKNRAKQLGDKQSPKGDLIEDPMAKSAREVLSQPWVPAKQ